MKVTFIDQRCNYTNYVTDPNQNIYQLMRKYCSDTNRDINSHLFAYDGSIIMDSYPLSTLHDPCMIDVFKISSWSMRDHA